MEFKSLNKVQSSCWANKLNWPNEVTFLLRILIWINSMVELLNADGLSVWVLLEEISLSNFTLSWTKSYFMKEKCPKFSQIVWQKWKEFVANWFILKAASRQINRFCSEILLLPVCLCKDTYRHLCAERCSSKSHLNSPRSKLNPCAQVWYYFCVLHLSVILFELDVAWRAMKDSIQHKAWFNIDALLQLLLHSLLFAR